MPKYVLTRSGTAEPFDQKRIYNAVKSAAKGSMKSADIQYIVNEVKDFFDDDDEVQVEDIQTEVENALMHSRFPDVAREYVRYRQRHEMRRNASAELMEEYNDLLFTDPRDMDLKRDNANINTDAPMGIMLKLGTEGAKSYVYNYFLDEDVSKACKEGILHYHDADFSLITFNCLDGESKVSIKAGDVKKYVPFSYFNDLFQSDGAEIVDVSHKDWKTLSKNGDYTKINKVMRRPQSSGILKITTKDGKVLRASEDHVFVTVDGKEKTAKKLQVGDELPVAIFPEHFLPVASEDINLIDLFNHDLGRIYIANTDYVNANLPEDLQMFIKMRTDRYKQYKNSSSISFSLAEYKLIRKYVNLDESKIRLTTRGSKNCLPAVIKADEKIGKYIGYILTEGSMSDYGITFSNKDEEILTDFMKLQTDLFPDVKVTRTVNASGVTIFIMNSKLMRYLFEDAIAHKTNSSDIALADQFLYANESFTKGFVTAMIDGDGSMQNDGYRIRFSTTSEKAAVQLQYMLDTMNVKSRLSTRESAGQKAVVNGVATTRHYDTYIVDVTGDSLNKYRCAFPNTIIVNRIQKTLTDTMDHHRGKIVSIKKEAFDGFVYDFETEDHFFVSNGILVHNCCQIRLAKLLKDGFSTGHGFLREPNSIRAAAALAAIVIQSSQNDMFGGQSINAFDYDLAPYVNKSFRKAIKETAREWCRFNDTELDEDSCSTFEDMTYRMSLPIARKIICGAVKHASEHDADLMYQEACGKTKDETHQAMEALIHNFNTLHSRAGAQVEKIGA